MSAVPNNHNRGNVLVVDDTLVNLRILTEMLAAQGYKVRPVTSGPQALQAAVAAPPDLVLLDINMPGMTGYEV
ncbi:MAG: response regulator, partial [Myxococcales bacterium]|nr:response regulator [Myxococcales bacterium]